ncbi:MAG TPA: hypothetical protein PK671_20760, partial [Candidatus Obscuribacter sp.]|nr:hypothetical protein [Candidatus Obscuribacter sp.]
FHAYPQTERTRVSFDRETKLAEAQTCDEHFQRGDFSTPPSTNAGADQRQPSIKVRREAV